MDTAVLLAETLILIVPKSRINMIMSELLMNIPNSPSTINAYFDGARAAIRLYAVWKNGEQYVGADRLLQDVLQDIECMRQEAIGSRKNHQS